jgi:predicted pyridoxine 5'-phosphate oxidase superfamily flavin-nucleotide-binding protein
VLRDHMPQQHREFFALLPLLFTGTLDAQGQPWASVRAGPPGFLSSPTPQLLRIEGAALPADPAADHWAEGAAAGLLGLQAHTGRRNRLNGWIASTRGGIDVRVGQSFGNCPKYIQPREAVYAPAAQAPVQAHRSGPMDAASLRIVREADTFFIASAHPEAAASQDPARGVDVSHRGGPAGFVAVDGHRLLVPDYVGNTFFNTLGNLQLQARCGLLFIDFARGTRVHLACRARLLAEVPDPGRWPGALRLLELEVQECLRIDGGLPLRWRA